MHAISPESMLRTETKKRITSEEMNGKQAESLDQQKKRKAFRFCYFRSLNSEKKKFPFVRQSPSGINNEFMIVFFVF
jgi:hypothetical protein